MKLVERWTSDDSSIKHLWSVAEHVFVESICFPYDGAAHICISSQAGCPVACAFCETGRVRNHRNLTPEQIVYQVAATRNDMPQSVSDNRYKVVQFAGMGEPLLNFRSIAEAASAMLDQGLTEEVTLTTAGIVPRIRDLAETPINRLSVSLHATDNATRERLIPINKKFPLEDVIAAATDYKVRTRNKVTMNYLLLDGVNDSDKDLARFCRLIDPNCFSVKLKAWNEIADTDLRISPYARFDTFVDVLSDQGYDITICSSMGADIAGGCGQLSANHQIAVSEALPVSEAPV